MSPTGRLLLLSLGPCLISLLIPVYPFVKLWVLLADAALVAIVALDALTLPGRGSLRVSRKGPSILSVGVSNPFQLAIDSRMRRSIRVAVTESFPSSMEVRGLAAHCSIPARSRHVILFTVVPRRRGAFDVGRTYLRVTSLLGLWRRQLRLAIPHPVKVFPDVRALNTYGLLARRNRIDLMGFRKTRGRGSDVEFDRLRDYQPDDDYRRIDPFASARHRKLITREYEVSRNQNIFFMVDCSRLMAAESAGLSNLDHALNATLMMSYLALDLGDNVGLMAFDDRVRSLLPLSAGVRSKTAVLHALYDVHESPGEADYETAFLTFNRRVRKRSLIVLYTNIMDAGSFDLLRPHLQILTRRHLPLVLLLRDADLFELADTAPADLQGFYACGAAAELARWREGLSADLQKMGALVLDIDPVQTTPDLINTYLRIKADQLL